VPSASKMALKLQLDFQQTSFHEIGKEKGKKFKALLKIQRKDQSNVKQ
jgi:hypothetical protein